MLCPDSAVPQAGRHLLTYAEMRSGPSIYHMCQNGIGGLARHPGPAAICGPENVLINLTDEGICPYTTGLFPRFEFGAVKWLVVAS